MKKVIRIDGTTSTSEVRRQGKLLENLGGGWPKITPVIEIRVYHD